MASDEHRSPLVVRPYLPSDRDWVRSLCCDVAAAGKPLEGWLPLDRDLFADLFTRYYTDFEPEGLFLAQGEGGVLGYVTTCLDTGRYRRVWLRHVLLPCVARVVGGGARIPRRALGTLVGLAVDYVRGGGLRVPWRDYPGHLHINTHPTVRGCARVSRALLHQAFHYLRSHGVTRLHAVVMTARAHMERKYLVAGFQVARRVPAPHAGRGRRAAWLVLVMDLESMPAHPLDAEEMRTRARTLAGATQRCNLLCLAGGNR